MTHRAVTRALLVAAWLARPAGAEVVNLLAFQEGTVPVVEPSSYGSWTAMTMLDDDPASGWAAESGHVKNNVFVFEARQGREPPRRAGQALRPGWPSPRSAARWPGSASDVVSTRGAIRESRARAAARSAGR
jgi:hypothetical protein